MPEVVKKALRVTIGEHRDTAVVVWDDQLPLIPR
jgi:hypothetical protein